MNATEGARVWLIADGYMATPSNDGQPYQSHEAVCILNAGAQDGAAQTLYEKLDDAAMVQRMTGTCPTVAIHIPWDRVNPSAGSEQAWSPVQAYTRERGIFNNAYETR